MRTLYLECNMGAAGDMLMAALLELHADPEGFVKLFNRLGIPGVKLEKEAAEKCGITGTHIKVTVHGEEEHSHDIQENEPHFHDHAACGKEEQHGHSHGHTHHHHSNLQQICALIESLAIPEQVKKDAEAVYKLIAEAESQAHGRPMEEIHFHEVGTMDAVADVVGVCMLIHELAPDRIQASPVHVGSGQVQCAHGILPVPAPATAWILRDVPIYGGRVQGELCTPTGAALLKYFVNGFDGMPVMRVKQTGYGMGQKDFPEANCLRAMLGESEEIMDSIVELCCNLDDMTPEAVGFATELLMKEGALDVYTASVQMKKNRPGLVLTCMCKKEQKEKMLELIFRHTTTLGIREYECRRYGLKRTLKEKETEFGTIHVKVASGYGVQREKAEYDELAGIARKNGLSLKEVSDRI